MLIEHVETQKGDKKVDKINKAMLSVMMDNVGIYRNGSDIDNAINKLKELRQSTRQVHLSQTDAN